jgi:hypothetical protein
VFENTETMRWQVQEMARVERMLRDEQIAHEVETYNQLIPDAGELSATLLVELGTKEQLLEWLPKLVGIHQSIAFVLADGSEVRGQAQDEERLTREEVTPSVHFLKFSFMPEQVGLFESGPVRIRSDHAAYREDVTLSDDQRSELLGDLRA